MNLYTQAKCYTATEKLSAKKNLSSLIIQHLKYSEYNHYTQDKKNHNLREDNNQQNSGKSDIRII